MKDKSFKLQICVFVVKGHNFASETATKFAVLRKGMVIIMKKEYIMQGLHCADCAVKIENSVKKINGVMSANMNYITSTLLLELDSLRESEIEKKLPLVAHKFEPDIEIIDKIKKTHLGKQRIIARNKGDNKAKLTQLFLGAFLLFAALLLNTNGNYKLFLFLAGYILLGAEIILKAFKSVFRGRMLDENFLMSAATIGAFSIGEYPEAVAVMLFYQIGEYFQETAVKRSRKSIAELMDLSPNYANLKKDGNILKVSPEDIAVGDIIMINPGEKVPLDGIVIGGSSTLDTKALTGESAPRSADAGDAVISGCINQGGVLEVRVTSVYEDSTAAKITALVESAATKKAPAENFITVFSRYYTPIVVLLAAIIAVVPSLIWDVGWVQALHRGLVFLVISCPCALVISIPLSYFAGVGAASKKGVLVKGSNYLEALNSLEIVVFDKTGTLTKGTFEVMDICPENNFSRDELLTAAAYAEAFSNHPIATSICKAFGKNIDKDKLSNYEQLNGYGVSALINGKKLLAGNDRLMSEQGISFSSPEKTGTKIYVSIDNVCAGCIVISDELKNDSPGTISALRKKGVKKIALMTGDNAEVGGHIAKELQIDEMYAQLLPNQKVEKLEALSSFKRPGGTLAFVGDGTNDAPVLARADIGIAMGGLGSDAAIEAADIVLMTDEPSRLIDAMDTAAYTKRIVWQNIIFAIGVKIIFLILGAFGAVAMWLAVFADVGVSVLAIANSMRILKQK